MANTRELVRRRKSIRNTRKITKTMEMVATAKLAKAQQEALAARPFAEKLKQVIGELASAASTVKHPLLETNTESKRAVIVLMLSDRGLCGGFNANILRRGRELYHELKNRGMTVEIIAHGKKALTTLKFMGIEVAESFVKVSDKPDFLRAERMAEKLMARYARKEIDEAYVVYCAFLSATTQKPWTSKLLPLSGLSGASDDAPAKTTAGTESKPSSSVEYLYHPEPEVILKTVLPLVVKNSLFTAMLECTASEHAARRVAMKNATDAADDMIKSLTRQYNRARQSKITQEIAEIVGGAEAL